MSVMIKAYLKTPGKKTQIALLYTILTQYSIGRRGIMWRNASYDLTITDSLGVAIRYGFESKPEFGESGIRLYFAIW